MDGFTHINEKGEANMVDVGGKAETKRYARASGKIKVCDAVMAAVSGKGEMLKKGDILGTARVAGIMAAKRTAELIPLCHTLILDKVSVDFEADEDEKEIICSCEVRLSGKTGAEMEALTGVSVALLTIYDMCKAVDRAMVISDVRLEEKDGGKTGHFIRDPEG
ncbi:MAG: cyclic pyranopterin monophosphate synthase MoaC [Lachnospiraceae bacterium]|nr:cyclic pyranopterin monophosphate synthase MoaC [Lachnospiraceae bacterium]